MRIAVTGGLLLLSLGCADQGAVISAAASLSAPVDVSMLNVTFRDPFRSWQAHGSEFTSDGTLALPHSREWSTATGGSIDVAFEMVDSTGIVLTAGQVSLALRSDWRWQVDFMNATQDPRLRCMGCSGSRAFSLPVAYQVPGHDSLWVVWGGNSISHPVTY